MLTPLVDPDTREWLEERVGAGHLERRLQAEIDSEARLLGQSRTIFHLENSRFGRSVLLHGLRALMLYGRGQRNARRPLVREHRIALAHLPEAFDGFTILQLTDLHVDIAADMPEVLAAAVEPLEYDLCVLTGDYRAATGGPFAAAVEGMTTVRASLREPVYGVLGNHDSLLMLPALEGLGIRMLMNENDVLERGGERIYIAGVDDPHYFAADDLKSAGAGIPDGAVRLLLAHSPEIYARAATAGFDALLCGHTHGGQICLPGGFPLMTNARAPRRYCAGSWRHRELIGYTSAGAGACVVDARFNCPPEVTLHRLVRV